MHLAHLSLHRLPVLHRRSSCLCEPGVTALRRAQRPGQDQPGRGVGYVATLGSPPGRRRRAAGAARRRARGRARAGASATTARCWSRSRSRPGGPTGPGSTGRRSRGPREVLGVLRSVLFAPEDLALVKGDPASGGGSSTTCWSLRAPRFAGVRADYDRVLKQRNALLKSAGGRRRGQRPRRTCAPSRSGTPTSPTAGAELLAAPARAGRRAAAARRQGLRVGRRGARDRHAPARHRAARRRSTYRAACPTGRRRRAHAARRRPRAAGRGDRSSSWPRCAGRSSTAASRLVGPHRDDLVLELGTLPGQGLREPRRVVVVRAGAAAGGVRPAARRPATAAASRCWSSTTCSPSSTPAAATGWPSMVAGAEQVLVTAAVPADVPAALAGARVDVLGGEVRRVP